MISAVTLTAFTPSNSGSNNYKDLPQFSNAAGGFYFKEKFTMAKKATLPLNTEREKEFVKTFESLSFGLGSWTVWQDFVTLSACSLSNVLDKRQSVWQKREDEYQQTAKKYSETEFQQFINLLIVTVKALTENPEQDFLGHLYMHMNFGNGWTGQFFTPWHVAEMMARMSIGDGMKREVEEKGFISVNDPTCGSGCMLLAFAQAYKNTFNESYHQSVLLVGQDIDPVVAKMCYIQLSLMGCAGYVIVGNSLTKPLTGDVLIPCDDENLWITPMFFTDIWTTRRLFKAVNFFEKKVENG